MMHFAQRLGWIFSAVAFLLLPSSSLADAQKNAGDLKFVAVLIWGTDGEKPAEANLKDIDPTFSEKLRKWLKWKNYYEVNRVSFGIKSGDTKRLKLSEKCEIEINYSEKEGMEVELIGEGKSVVKSRQSMPLKEPLILGGNARNETAWAVLIKPE